MIKHIEVEEICIKQVVNNPIYINGFFLYYFPCQEVVGAEKEIFEDVKTFIDQGFMILTGEDWGQEVIICGYDTEKRHILWKTEKEKHENKGTLIEWFEIYNFFAGNRLDQYLRLRPVKKQQKQGVLKLLHLK